MSGTFIRGRRRGIQLHSLSSDVIIAGLEAAPGDDIDADAEKILQVLKQANVIEQGSARLDVMNS